MSPAVNPIRHDHIKDWKHLFYVLSKDSRDGNDKNIDKEGNSKMAIISDLQGRYVYNDQYSLYSHFSVASGD